MVGSALEPCTLRIGARALLRCPRHFTHTYRPCCPQTSRVPMFSFRWISQPRWAVGRGALGQAAAVHACVCAGLRCVPLICVRSLTCAAAHAPAVGGRGAIQVSSGAGGLTGSKAKSHIKCIAQR